MDATVKNSIAHMVIVDTRDLEKMERMIRLVEIALIIGKNLVFMIAAFVGITFMLAIYNSAIGNIVGSIISLAFGAAGLLFFAQVRQTRRRHYRRLAKYRETRQQKYREAQAA
jgi:protein-S-isoprenylcysteine O-methyltransferase Ste14